MTGSSGGDGDDGNSSRPYRRSNGPPSSSPLSPFLKSLGQKDDCERPACDDTKAALTAALGRISSVAASSPSSTKTKAATASDKVVCPPTKDAIGASTWTLLHSMAAWYPDRPSSQDKKLISGFIDGLAKFYPCTWCAEDFQINVEKSPPRTETREDLCIWLCEQHNNVNEKLGKPLFRCNKDALDERWRKSSNSKCQK